MRRCSSMLIFLLFLIVGAQSMLSNSKDYEKANRLLTLMTRLRSMRQKTRLIWERARIIGSRSYPSLPKTDDADSDSGNGPVELSQVGNPPLLLDQSVRCAYSPLDCILPVNRMRLPRFHHVTSKGEYENK